MNVAMQIIQDYRTDPFTVDLSDSEGLSIVGKVVIFVAKGTTKGEKVVGTINTMEEALKLQREGEEIKMASEKLAREIARDAGGGATPIKEFDEASQTWHYHPADRSGGHVLWSATAAVTFEHYAEGTPPANQTAAKILDIFNPLSLGKDLVDLYQWWKKCGAPNPKKKVFSYLGPNGELYVGENPPSGYKQIP